MVKYSARAFLILGCLFTCLCGGLAFNLYGYAADQVPAFHGAVLVRNGKPTSCELAMISNRFGYVAATCFELDADHKVMNLSQYKVVFDDHGKPPTPGRFGVANVIIHHSFDPKSYANNVALVEISLQSTPKWSQYIDNDPEGKPGVAFVRRPLANVDSQEWDEQQGEYGAVGFEETCVLASRMYNENRKDMLCAIVDIFLLSGEIARIPYSLGYGDSGVTLTTSAIYSHTVWYPANQYGSVNYLHYYTLLYNYNAWAAQYIPDTKLFASNETAGTNSTDYAMNPPTKKDISGLFLFAGNIYDLDDPANFFVKSAANSARASFATATHTSSAFSLTKISVQTSPTATESPSDTPTAPATAASSSSNYFSKNQIIAIAVSVPLAAIVILVALFFAYRWWVKHKSATDQQAASETPGMRTVALDLGGAGTTTDELLRYGATAGSLSSSHVASTR